MSGERPLSPIERMIDAACGFGPETKARRLMIVLECPECGKTKTVRPDKTDPHGTARVRATCNECPDDAGIVDYFNEVGQQIDLDGHPIRRIPHDR